MGEAGERERDTRMLLFYILGAAVAIFFVLQARLDSWRLGVLQFGLLLVPLAGAVLGAATQGGRISTLSLFGGLTALAIAVRWGLMLCEECQRLEREGGMKLGPDLVQRAAEGRFGATMLSTVAGIVTLLPLMIYGSGTGLEIVAPMVAMVIGGLLGAAVANLFLLPALYLRFAERAGRAGSGAPAQRTV
jgi:Cu/Ag efflux pump CusA